MNPDKKNIGILIKGVNQIPRYAPRNPYFRNKFFIIFNGL
jgi:hypothetical protein